MKGLMPVTLAVILYLVAVLEATYLERPLWVADKGRQQSLSHANEESRIGQFQGANEQAWVKPEQFYPQRSGLSNQEWVENQQRPKESPNAAQIVREERPPMDSFLPNQGYDGWNLPDAAYEYQTKNQAPSMNNGQPQSSWLNQQQQQQPEYQKPFVALEPSKLQPQPEPEHHDAYGQQGWNLEPKPENHQLNNHQSQFQTQDNYQPYRTDLYQPKPDAEVKPQNAQLSNYQPQFLTQDKYPPYRTDLYQPKPDAEAKPEKSPLNNNQPQFQTQDKYPPYRIDLYQPKPDAEAKPEKSPLHNNQPQFQTQDKYPPYKIDLYQPKPDAEAKPEKSPLNNNQLQFQTQDKYQPYKTDLYQPKPDAEVKNKNAQLNNYLPQFQTQDNYQPYRTDLYQSKPDAEAKPENAQLNNYQPQFQTQDKYQPYRSDLYQPKPDAEAQKMFNQPKPGSLKPNQPNVESFPPNPEDMQQNFPPKRPQELQQSYNPYQPRPELYQPSPSFVEPEYQGSYYGQQAFPTNPEYQMQKPVNKLPSQQTSKPMELPNKVKKPTNQPEKQVGQAPLTNSGNYPYQAQDPWYSYQQNPTDGIQASVQAAPDTRVGDNMSIYQLPSLQGSYGREPVVEKLKPVDHTQQQENRKPSQPLRTEQRPNRPIEQSPEEPKYQPNRAPSTSWETQYTPQQAPVVPKPQPQAQQRPPAIEPMYNRRPEPYYGGNDDDDNEVVVKYVKPITRFDKRCPRDDDPAKPVHFPSATSCVKFQKCYNGIAYEMSCPTGLEFDAMNSRCDYPARARCTV